MKLLVINGPNINMLGIREKNIYGTENYKSLVSKIKAYCKKKKVTVSLMQSNYEGDIVTAIQKAYQKYDGIIINPAAYTHTSIAILDALKAVNIDTVEVHISNVNKRESFRKKSTIKKYCKKSIVGHGTKGYIEAIDYFLKNKSND
jgi:3-dehydroquinate dehydratase-2